MIIECSRNTGSDEHTAENSLAIMRYAGGFLGKTRCPLRITGIDQPPCINKYLAADLLGYG